MGEFQERWYQKESSDAVLRYIYEEDGEGHPIVVLPTGAGKTVVICGIIDRFLTWRPHEEVLVLSHVQEILEQNFEALESHFGEDSIGLWSSGLGSKIKKKITVAGIQSVHRSAKSMYRSVREFANVGLILIDECHLINHKDAGMYRSFLKHFSHAVYAGLTATPFRLGHGYIHQGKGALFTEIVYDMSSMDNFNKLVSEGYLAKLITKKTLLQLDTNGISVRGGDFSQDELSVRLDREGITEEAVKEIVHFGTNYKKWLVFAIDIAHSEHICNRLRDLGIPSAVVHSKMEGGRKDVINDFKLGKYRALVNVDVLTTGFDVRDIDLIALMRPTKSPVVHVQSIGRGLRVCEGKDHCLVLDFAGNTKRIGPINDIRIADKEKRGGGGEPPVKECPECGTYHHGSVRVCDVCDHVFEFKEKLKYRADDTEVVKKSNEPITEWLDVDKVEYSIHEKKGKPSSMKVTYFCGMVQLHQFVCYDHKGYAKHLAKHWVRNRISGEMPSSVGELFARREELKKPVKIFVDATEKFPEIRKYEWA